MTEEQAKRRFFLLAGIRLSGVVIAFFGIAVVMKRLVEPADIIGAALIAIGGFEVMVLPTLLLRSWRKKD